MKLDRLRRIVEQDVGASGVAYSGTDSGDVAAYPFPLSLRSNDPIPRLFAPNVYVLPSNRFVKSSKLRKRKANIYQENMEYTPWDKKDHSLSVIMEYIGKELQKRLVPFGFNITIGDENVELISNSGRIFEYKVVDRYVTLTEGRTNISVDSQLGISADGPLFMAFPVPKGQSSNSIWNIVESSWWIVLKYDMLLEVAPFVDKSELDQETLSALGEHFILIPKQDYRGTFDHVGFYRKIFAPEPEIRDAFNEAMDLDHFKPVNNWGARFVHFDHGYFHDALKDVEKFGTKPKQKGTDLYWNDDLRVRFSPNGIGIVEVANAGHWYAIHAIPIIPKEYHDEYAEELRAFVQSYKKPDFFYGKWNMPDILWRIWEANAGEPSYNSAIAFHKDGVWGIDYSTAGMGRGTFEAALMDAPFIQYRLTILDEGLSFCSEQILRNKQSLNLAPWDINVLFYEGFKVEDIVRFVSRFTFSS